jgi:hypothetical protein
MTGDLALSGADVTFGDNDKAIFGAGSDLSIYHDGSNSYIDEQGTGSLNIRSSATLRLQNAAGANFLYGTVGGEVVVYYDGNPKFSTTSTGVDITGTLTSDGLTVVGNILLNGEGDELQFNTSGTPVNKIYSDDTYTTNGLTIDAENGVTLKSINNYLLLDDTTTNEMVLNVDNGERMRVTSTGVDITGTLTSDGLTVDTDAYRRLLLTYPDNFTSKLQVGFSNFYVQGSATNDRLTIANNSSGQTHFENQSKTSMVIDNSGDISFYEDTGITPKLVWKAADERLGIGTDSPESLVELETTSATVFDASDTSGQATAGSTLAVQNLSDANNTFSQILFRNRNSSKAVSRIASLTNGTGTQLSFVTENSGTPAEAMRIDSSGRVGIGTSSPSSYWASADDLVVATSGNTGISVVSGTTSLGYLIFADSTAGGDNTRGGLGYDHSTNDMLFRVNNDTKMRIDSSGNVGIGTSPDFPLHVSSTGVVLGLNATSGAVSQRFNENGTARFFLSTLNGSNGLAFVNGDGTSERMRIDSSGNLLVGTTDSLIWNEAATDNSKEGVVISPQALQISRYQDTQALFNRQGNSTGTNLVFANDGVQVGSVTTSGSATGYNTSSDYRLKTDAQPMTGSSARVQALNPVNFAWIADGTRVDGFLAHEAQAVVPEAVTGTKDAVDADGNPEYQGIDQSKLVPLLTAALQEALTKIDALETRITALEG